MDISPTKTLVKLELLAPTQLSNGGTTLCVYTVYIYIYTQINFDGWN